MDRKDQNITMLYYFIYWVKEFLYGGAKIKIPKDALVLEVAGGGKPYWRSNILVDKFISDSSERDSDIIIDRDFVVADVCKLPFKDKTFDFVIARHILEHLYEPEIFFKEIQRVAKAGYIETPAPLSEELFGWPFHIWKVSIENGVITLVSKGKAENVQLKKLQPYFDRNSNLQSFSRKHRDVFYTCFYWNDEIKFNIVKNCELMKELKSAEVGLKEFDLSTIKSKYGLKRKLKIFNDRIRRHFFAKNRKYTLDELVSCQSCGSSVNTIEGKIQCTNCQKTYDFKNRIGIFV